MATIISPPPVIGEERFVLRNISWETYEHLLADHADASSPRFTYDEGMLEIMSPLVPHARLDAVMADIADIIAEEQQVEFEKFGPLTFRRRDLRKGLEPDACFYIQNVERIRGKKEIDLKVDPPPDLVIEVEITNPVLPKLPIYARLEVPEVWLYQGGEPKILRLRGEKYEETDRSGVLPSLSKSLLAEFIEQSQTLTTLEWRRRLRTWAREQTR